MTMPDTVILNAQKQIYVAKDAMADLEGAVTEAQEKLRAAEAALAHGEVTLREWAEFLDEHNHDAFDRPGEWYKVVGLEPPRCKGTCARHNCGARCSMVAGHTRYGQAYCICERPECDR